MPQIHTYPRPAGALTGNEMLAGDDGTETLAIPVSALTEHTDETLLPLKADGSRVPSANLPMGGKKLTGLGVSAAAGEAVTNGESGDALHFQPPSASFYRGMAAKVAEIERSIADYAVGDYNPATATGTDITPGILDFFSDVGSRGGRLAIPDGYLGRIAQSFTLPEGVTIDNPAPMVGANDTGHIPQLGAALYVDPTASMLVRSGTKLGVNILRTGLQFGINSALVTSTFKGSPIILDDSTSDTLFEDMMILGFEMGVRTNTTQDTAGVDKVYVSRTKFLGTVGIDCINGIHIHNASDIPVLTGLHLWPFVTVLSPAEAEGAQLKRAGTAVWLSGLNDWTRAIAPFNFGYKLGFRVTDASSVRFVSAGSDYPYQSQPDGSAGALIDGASAEGVFLGFQAAQRDSGALVQSTSSLHAATFIGSDFWENRVNGVAVTSGDVQVIGGRIRSSFPGANGVQAHSGKTRVIGVDFRNLTGSAIIGDDTTVDIQHMMCTFKAVSTLVTNPYSPSLAAIDPLPLDGEKMALTITAGVASIGTVLNAAAYESKIVALYCAAAVSFIDGPSLKLNGNFAAAAGSVLMLLGRGGAFVEIARSSPGA